MKKLILTKLITLFFICTVIILFQSCGKDDEVVAPPPPPPPPSPKDTLSVGWQKIYVDSSTFLVDIAFPTPQIGYVCGNQYLGKSIDGGLTWTKFNMPDSLKGNFSFLFFRDENTGWVTTQTFILRTTNGGASWKKGPINNPTDLQFVTPSIGYVATMSGLYKSIDSGASYQKVTAAGSVQHDGVFFFDENNGWVTGPNFIEATQNSGSSFNKRTALSAGIYYNIQFTDVNHGWTSGAQTDDIWLTKNGGVSWEKIGGLPTQTDIHFFNNNDGYISTNYEIYKTPDAGTTLAREVHSVSGKIIETCFTDPNHGWATAGGYIYRLSK